MATYLKGISIREVRDLYDFQYRNIESRISYLVSNMQRDDKRVEERLGRPVKDCDILEIGPGQRSPYRYYYGLENRYTGIDLEPALEGNILFDLFRDIRSRGVPRGVKTFGRRALGLDRKFRKEMLAQLEVDRLGGEIRCMNAEALEFRDESIDVVLSTSVFEHLPHPERVMSEIARVLRPGGVAHIITHLFTCDSGIHDTRIFSGNRDGIPFWSHLRVGQRDKVNRNSYLNEMRLDQYRRAFDLHWRGVDHIVLDDAPAEQRQELARLRKSGELSDFADEELLSSALISVWKKPGT